MVTSNKDKMWTTVDLYEQYIKDGGVLLSRRQLLDRVLQATGENFILLKSPGIASLIVPKAYANSTLRLQEVDNEALEADPPALEPTEYGWTKEDEMLLPTTLPDGVDPLPQEVLKVIACNCQTDEPCRQGNCTCKKNKMACSMFCKCRGVDCFSSLTPKTEKNTKAANDDDDDDDDDG